MELTDTQLNLLKQIVDNEGIHEDVVDRLMHNVEGRGNKAAKELAAMGLVEKVEEMWMPTEAGIKVAEEHPEKVDTSLLDIDPAVEENMDYFKFVDTAIDIVLTEDSDEVEKDQQSPYVQLDEMYAITGGGLRKLPDSGQLNFKPGTECFLGASSSPKHIIVVKADPKWLYYVHGPEYKKERRIQRQVGEDLINQGTSTWVNSGMAKYHADAAKQMKKWLEGGKPVIVDPKDFQRVYIYAISADPSKDMWRQAERYGGVGGIDVGDIMVYEIYSDYGRLRELEKDKTLQILMHDDEIADRRELKKMLGVEESRA